MTNHTWQCSGCQSSEMYRVRDLYEDETRFPAGALEQPPDGRVYDLQLGSIVLWRLGVLVSASALAVLPIPFMRELPLVEYGVALLSFLVYLVLFTLVANGLYVAACRRQIERWLQTPSLRFTMREAVLAVRFNPAPTDDKRSYLLAIVFLILGGVASVAIGAILSMSLALRLDKGGVMVCIALFALSSLLLIPMQRWAKARLERKKRHWSRTVAPLMQLAAACGLEEELQPASFRAMGQTLKSYCDAVSSICQIPILGQLVLPVLLLFLFLRMLVKAAEIHLLDPLSIEDICDDQLICLPCLDLLISCRT